MKRTILITILILCIGMFFCVANILWYEEEFYDIRPYFYSNTNAYKQMADFLIAHSEHSGWAVSGSRINWDSFENAEVPKAINKIAKELRSKGGLGAVQIDNNRKSILFRCAFNEGTSYICFTEQPIEELNPKAFENSLYQCLADNWYYFCNYRSGSEKLFPNPTFYIKPFNYRDMRPPFNKYIEAYDNIARYMEENETCIEISRGNGLNFYALYNMEDNTSYTVEFGDEYWPAIKKDLQTLYIYGEVHSIYKGDYYNSDSLTNSDDIRFLAYYQQEIIYSTSFENKSMELVSYYEKLSDNWHYLHYGEEIK